MSAVIQASQTKRGRGFFNVRGQLSKCCVARLFVIGDILIFVAWGVKLRDDTWL